MRDKDKIFIDGDFNHHYKPKSTGELTGICPHHNKMNLGYMEWHAWADEQIKKGEKQKRCPVCKRYFFPSEM